MNEVHVNICHRLLTLNIQYEVQRNKKLTPTLPGTCLTSKKIDASGVGDVRGNVAGTHMQAGLDVSLLDLTDFVLGIGLCVRLRPATFLPLLFLVLMPLGRDGAFDLIQRKTLMMSEQE